MEQMTRLNALRTFFHRTDQFAPEGGRKIEMQELKDLTKAERDELGELAAKELGVEIVDVKAS